MVRNLILAAQSLTTPSSLNNDGAGVIGRLFLLQTIIVNIQFGYFDHG